MNNNPITERPIRSLQNFLRRISQSDNRIPPIIPDGIYGNQTRRSVSMFQLAHGLPATGRTDERTWNEVLNEYNKIVDSESNCVSVCLYPGAFVVIDEGQSHECLYPLQGIMKVITGRAPHLGTLHVTGVHDRESVAVVRKLQRIMGHEVTGKINKKFYEDFAMLYRTVMKDT